MGRMRGLGLGLATAAALLSTAGCAAGGILDGWGSPRGNDVIDGEVYRVDSRRMSVVGYDGRTRSVNVHRDTRVRYDRRTYPVSALERGDEVRVYVTWDRGTPWADVVDVRRSVRATRPRTDRYGYRGRVERLDGYLLRLSLRDRWMAVAPRRGSGEVIVHLPSRLDRDDARRLQRLRRGDRLRLDVVPVGRSEAELVRVR